MNFEDPVRVDLRHLPDGAMRLTIDIPADNIIPSFDLEKGSAFLSYPTEHRLRNLIFDLERDRDKRMPANPKSWTGLAERAGYARQFEEQHEALKVALRRNWALIAGRFDSDPADAPDKLAPVAFDQWVRGLDLTGYQSEAMIAAMTALVDQATRDCIKVVALDDHLARISHPTAASVPQAKEHHHV